MFKLPFRREHSCAKAFDDWSDEAFEAIWAYIPDGDRTPFVQCMPDEYKGRDATSAYKRYFWGEKVDHSTRWFKTNFNGAIPSVWGAYLEVWDLVFPIRPQPSFWSQRIFMRKRFVAQACHIT